MSRISRILSGAGAAHNKVGWGRARCKFMFGYHWRGSAANGLPPRLPIQPTSSPLPGPCRARLCDLWRCISSSTLFLAVTLHFCNPRDGLPSTSVMALYSRYILHIIIKVWGPPAWSHRPPERNLILFPTISLPPSLETIYRLKMPYIDWISIFFGGEVTDINIKRLYNQVGTSRINIITIFGYLGYKKHVIMIIHSL